MKLHFHKWTKWVLLCGLVSCSRTDMTREQVIAAHKQCVDAKMETVIWQEQLSNQHKVVRVDCIPVKHEGEKK